MIIATNKKRSKTPTTAVGILHEVKANGRDPANGCSLFTLDFRFGDESRHLVMTIDSVMNLQFVRLEMLRWWGLIPRLWCDSGSTPDEQQVCWIKMLQAGACCVEIAR